LSSLSEAEFEEEGEQGEETSSSSLSVRPGFVSMVWGLRFALRVSSIEPVWSRWLSSVPLLARGKKGVELGGVWADAWFLETEMNESGKATRLPKSMVPLFALVDRLLAKALLENADAGASAGLETW